MLSKKSIPLGINLEKGEKKRRYCEMLKQRRV
jgi:hypothetical protein